MSNTLTSASTASTTLTVLGSTGSIGTQTLAVARQRGYRVQALAAGRNLSLLAEQVAEFSPRYVSVDPAIYVQAKAQFGAAGPQVIADINELAAQSVTVVVNAISGLAGLAPSRAALEAGQALALATKEAMVTASDLIWQAAKNGGGRLVPIDSEHTGIYQCLTGERLGDIAELILTASGGPFRQYQGDLSAVTPQQALQHPSWNMGPKITIDSATLMNKGLEVMECAALYGLPLSQVKVVVHPQSIVHAAVRFCDGSLKAQFGPPDMRLPIAYALDAAPAGMRFAGDLGEFANGLSSQGRGPEVGEHLSWPLLGSWDFFSPDSDRFPCLALAYRAGAMGGLAGATLNAADEIAVDAFLQNKIKFTDIARIISQILDETPQQTLTWDSLAEAEQWARQRTNELLH